MNLISSTKKNNGQELGRSEFQDPPGSEQDSSCSLLPVGHTTLCVAVLLTRGKGKPQEWLDAKPGINVQLNWMLSKGFSLSCSSQHYRGVLSLSLLFFKKVDNKRFKFKSNPRYFDPP